MKIKYSFSAIRVLFIFSASIPKRVLGINGQYVKRRHLEVTSKYELAAQIATST